MVIVVITAVHLCHYQPQQQNQSKDISRQMSSCSYQNWLNICMMEYHRTNECTDHQTDWICPDLSSKISESSLLAFTLFEKKHRNGLQQTKAECTVRLRVTSCLPIVTIGIWLIWVDTQFGLKIKINFMNDWLTAVDCCAFQIAHKHTGTFGRTL